MQPPAAVAAAPAPAKKNDYRKPNAWLCRPGRKDDCTTNLTTTVIAADGTLSTERWAADRKAAVDCFYVYPTVSNDTSGNSDMRAGPEEKNVVVHQLARFGAQCRLYAPLYRQITLAALRAGIAGKPIPADRELGYNDVVDAWNDYLAHDNKGRGVVLIGHSQGARVLTELIRNHIDVPKGADVGGTFLQMPLCRSNDQTGCIISYASFRASAPPPPNSRFGKAPDGQLAACTNPAALAGGSGTLHAYLSAKASSTAALPPGPWLTPEKPIKTEFVSVPGLLSGECVSNANGSYLAVSVHGDPKDGRTDEIVGDIVSDGKVQADWGLHLIDMSLAMGDLLDVVGRQVKAYTVTARSAADLGGSAKKP
jgi:pimeloyl-ACP methyl ester carboxylesterase